ncbi:hypothetical protein TKK_0002925 [Trichogramma kaykai]
MDDCRLNTLEDDSSDEQFDADTSVGNAAVFTKLKDMLKDETSNEPVNLPIIAIQVQLKDKKYVTSVANMLHY